MKKSYTSPSVRFRSLQLRERIADICWAYGAGHAMETLYWNFPGHGFLAFYLNKGLNCDNGIDQAVVVGTSWSSGYNEPAYDTLNEITVALAALGGNSSEPFKGSGDSITTNPPYTPTW